MVIQDCTYLNQTTNLRLFLKENFYSREEIIQQLIDSISQCFETFTINYDPQIQSIRIKIKITNMKKRYPDYEHISTYYYSIMNNILTNVIMNNTDTINTIYNTSNKKYNSETSPYYVDLSYLSYISSIYNVTTLLDNIVVINL